MLKSKLQINHEENIDQAILDQLKNGKAQPLRIVRAVALDRVYNGGLSKDDIRFNICNRLRYLVSEGIVERRNNMLKRA